MTETDKIAVDVLLEAIFRRYGYDFRHYAKASLRRRVSGFLDKTDCRSIAELIPPVLEDQDFFARLVKEFSVTVTEMFRDPPFFAHIRQLIVPYLRTYPFIKIWHAGCATGEEVYSLAVLLKEEGLYDRSTIFATDFNDEALADAKTGIYDIKHIKMFTQNYQEAGGKSSFSDYYHAGYNSVIFDKSLRENVTFANHNLVTDGAFGEMQLILCRNVLIYFDRPLQNRVLNLFDLSLSRGGFLCLGNRESIRFADIYQSYKAIDEKYRIFRK